MKKEFRKLGKDLIPVAIIIAVILIAVVIIYITQFRDGTKNQEVLAGQLPPQEAGVKAITYINQNLLQPGTTASLANVVEENGVYKFQLQIGENKYDSYITKDGKILFTSGISLEPTPTPSITPTPTPQQPKASCEDLKKTGKALMEAFVVSKCPYGLQMQRILYEIVKNIPSLEENIKVRYIGAIEGNKITAMHGDEEAQENLRQICIREEDESKYWDYVTCHIKKGDVDSCLTSANVDKSNIEACMADSARGLKYAKEDFDLQGEYSVSGSPTLFLNGEKVSEFDFGGRTAEALKTLLCCGFKSNLDICSQKLLETQAATGFSETYASASGSSSDAACGQ
jgi:hypothetical protein